MIVIGFNKVFKAISNPVRLEILDLLKKGDRSASEIASEFHLSAATISHHLSVLKEHNLIYDRRYKNYIYYGINTSVVEDMMAYLARFIDGGSNE